jgi:micrococcal nuclease
MRLSKKTRSLIVLLIFLLSYYFGNLHFPQLPQGRIPTPLPRATDVSFPTPFKDTLGVATGSATPSAEILFKVSKVVDGDTIEIQKDKQLFKLRLIGIDTPETVDPRRGVQCFGKEASNETKRVSLGREVRLEKDVSEIDKYQRILRYVYVKLDDGSFLFLNDYLVRAGFAKSLTYPPDVKYQTRFQAAEQEARSKNLGLWGKCSL